MMTDQELMESLKTKYGTVIAAAAATSHVPASFLAALIANESGGDPNAKRYEPRVLGELFEVLIGRKLKYGAVTSAMLRNYLMQADFSLTKFDAFGPILQRLDGVATSWGITQIMGYEIFDSTLRIDRVMQLQVPQTSLQATVLMLAQFAQRNALDLASSFSELFDCWNTGRPHGKTFDPDYVVNGLRRMEIYKALP